MGLLTATAGPAGQRSSNATLHVGMTVAPQCTVRATPLDFGSYDPQQAHATQPLDAQAIVTTSCTPNTRLRLDMDRGLHAAGTTRRMSSGGDFIRYELFKDAGRVQIWGPGSEGLRFRTPANNNAPVLNTVYGRIEPGQNVTEGDYDDTIEIVLHF